MTNTEREWRRDGKREKEHVEGKGQRLVRQNVLKVEAKTAQKLRCMRDNVGS